MLLKTDFKRHINNSKKISVKPTMKMRLKYLELPDNITMSSRSDVRTKLYHRDSDYVKINEP